VLFLRQNKNEKRKVDAKIETGEAEILEKYSDMLKNGIIRKGIEEEEEDFDKAARQGFGAVKHLGKKQNATQDYFQPKNFHLIVWETVENL
jgi:hypothetical protein